MMRQKTIILAFLLTAMTHSVTAQTSAAIVRTDTTSLQKDSTTVKKKKVWPSFLSHDLLPDGSNYLPAPPDFNNRLFVGDLLWHLWGKELRDTPRGEQARREAELTLKSMFELFNEPFGIELSEEATPLTADLIGKVVTDACSSTRKAKRHYKRLRPFLYFNEGTLVPEEEESHHTPSYPSSHAASGWAVALVLSELQPGRAEQILKAGYEYGDSRIIAGYHYKSDVEAGRLTASACVARLHADEGFEKQMKKVKKELEKAKKEQEKAKEE